MDNTPISTERILLLGGLAYYAQDEQIRLGIQRYRQRCKHPWRVLDAGHEWGNLNQHLERYQPDGVIAHILDHTTLDRVRNLGVPAISLNREVAGQDLPVLSVNNRTVGRMAAEHFLERGMRRMVVYATASWNMEQDRIQGFMERMTGEEIHDLCQIGGSPFSAYSSRTGVLTWERKTWMKELEPPFALFCASGDLVAAQLCDMAASLGLRVPEDVLVLGVDDFKLLCESCIPPLSSIAMPGEELGFQAAACMDRMFREEAPHPPNALLPLGVTERRSTESAAVDDPDLSRALRYLYEHAAERISIGNMVRELRLPRRSLQRKFTRILGRTPLEELYRRRVEMARTRLLETSDPIYVIAVECGFRDAESFSRRFREQVGSSPSAYRKTHHL